MNVIHVIDLTDSITTGFDFDSVDAYGRKYELQKLCIARGVLHFSEVVH
jgi:hypothetical protein